MSVDFTAFDAQLTGTNGAAGSAGGDGGDGGNAIESLAPFSNTDFSLEPSLARVFPTVTGGNGGGGAGGAIATATTPAVQGGIGGKGGAAIITLDRDIFGSAATHYIGVVTITMSVDASVIGAAGGGTAGAGGAGGRGGLGITVVTGVNGSQDSVGSDGAIGGAGGIGEVANADLTAMISYATSDLSIVLITNGGKGGQGGFGGSGGSGTLSAGNGANGAPGGAGAPAEATFSGATAFNDSAIFVTEKPTGGLGGSGGNGGIGGNLGPIGLPATGFGANGNGAAGGRGGDASATVSGDTLTAPSVQFTLDAYGGLGGAGGLGGNAGPAPGLSGVAGSDGAGSITFTNNVITVGSGIPGDTQLSGSDLLLLNLRVATIGPAGFFAGTLNGGVGGNLNFSGNTFIGDGASRLVLQLGSTGTATVDTASNTVSIDGSPTSNTISGFTTFDLDINDTFVAGGGSYRVTFAPDPDTLVMTPTSGNVTLLGITSTNFLLDFRGFGPSFDSAALAADTNTSTGSTVITLSPTSVITLQGYTGGIAPGDVLFEPACYVRGTRIATPDGEVAIETLVAGNLVVTASGAQRAIKWIGRRAYAGRFLAANPSILPICFRAFSLGDGLPRQNLFVSPKHAMFIDDVLIPAECLVNNVSILRERDMERVEYFHLELEAHDVLLAEGAPSESFVDDDNRGMFHNAAEYRMLYPDAVRTPAQYCAPRVEDGEVLEIVRRRLAMLARAGKPADTAAKPAVPLAGYIDQANRNLICGWAWDTAAPDQPVRLRILANGVAIGEVTADKYRADLLRAGIGQGRHGFEWEIPGSLSSHVRHVIEVQHATDERPLPRSPWTLEAVSGVTSNAVLGHACRGHLDLVTRENIVGWAVEDFDTDAAVALEILDNGTPIGRVLANRYRADIAQAGFGNGRSGFDIRIPGLSPLERHVISVRRERDGAELINSPMTIEPADSFGTGLEEVVASAVTALGSNEQGRVLSFMLAQADRLMQQNAAAEGRRSERLAYQQFRRRWGPPGATDTMRDPGLRALVIDDRVPVTSRDAGSQAILSHMRGLQSLGYAVTFVAAEEMSPPVAAIALLADSGIACCSKPFYASVEDVLRRQEGCFDAVYLHRADIASSYLALARRCNPKARTLYSVADLHHVRLERQSIVEDRPELLAASQRMRLTEFTAALSADAVLTHSVDEAAILRRALPQANVRHAPWDIPIRRSDVPFTARNGVAFIGGYSHAPNVDAAHWLVDAVMPLVWQIDPAIECMLVGSEMPISVRNLAGRRVVVAGQVEDLGVSVFDRVRLTVAPLRYGAGVKGKVLESFAAGIPCVMTEIAAEGLALPATLRAMVGSNAASLARIIAHVHASQDLTATVGRAGHAWMRASFSADAIAQALGAALGLHMPAAIDDTLKMAVGDRST